MDQSLFSRLATEQPLRDAAFTLGGLLMQPLQQGQNASGHAGSALISSLGVLRQGQAAEKQSAVEQQKLGLEERRTAATESQARTAAAGQKASAQNQQGQLGIQAGQLAETNRHNQAMEAQQKLEMNARMKTNTLEQQKLQNEQRVQAMKDLFQMQENDQNLLDGGFLTPEQYNQRWSQDAWETRLGLQMSLYQTGKLQMDSAIAQTTAPKTPDEAYEKTMDANPNMQYGSAEWKNMTGTISKKFPGWKPPAQSQGEAAQAEIARRAAAQAQVRDIQNKHMELRSIAADIDRRYDQLTLPEVKELIKKANSMEKETNNDPRLQGILRIIYGNLMARAHQLQQPLPQDPNAQQPQQQ